LPSQAAKEMLPVPSMALEMSIAAIEIAIRAICSNEEDGGRLGSSRLLKRKYKPAGR
jgi:hypothetical protein